jgi:RHS repeat-associated protein
MQRVTTPDRLNASSYCLGVTQSSYYRARYYDLGAGRFLSEDPLDFGGGDVVFYKYAKNDPTGLIDPLGMNADSPPITWPWWLLWNPGKTGEIVEKVLGVGGRAVGIGVTVVLDLTLFAPSVARDEDMLKNRPLPCDKNKHDCAQEWADAYAMCRELLARPHPPRAMTGGYTDVASCARGLVSEECGGNPVGKKK